MKINLPNQLTLLRLFLIPFFLFFVVHHDAISRFVALIVFTIASLTDLYDGKLARARGMVTVIGTFLDPLADKLLISSAFIVFTQMKEFYIPAWMIVLIIGREFLITGLRTLAISKGRVLPAQKAGKFKTTSQMIAIFSILVILFFDALFVKYEFQLIAFAQANRTIWNGIEVFLKHGPYWMTALATAFTIISGYMYLQDNIDLLDEK